MWQELPEDDPELVVDSPPCTPFSPLIARVGFSSDAFRGCGCHGGRGLGAHRHSLSGGAKWQHSRKKVFLFEHPHRSKVWDEDYLGELMHLPSVFCCVVDMCAFGMRVGKLPNRKRTIKNLYHIAYELQRQCPGIMSMSERLLL